MSLYELETEEDMDAYFDAECGHGIKATYINSNNVSSVIIIILNNEFLEADEGVGIEGTQPIAYCKTLDLPGITFGNQLNVTVVKDVDGNILSPAQNYTVVSIQSDRTGFTSLELEKA